MLGVPGFAVASGTAVQESLDAFGLREMADMPSHRPCLEWRCSGQAAEANIDDEN